MERSFLIYLNAIHIHYNHMAAVIQKYQTMDNLLKNKAVDDNVNIPQSSQEKIDHARWSFDFEQYLNEVKRSGAGIITCVDEEFPLNLKFIPDPPYVLYYKGNLDPIFNHSIAIVGARKCTYYGRWATEKIAGELAEMGVPIVSGLALGIDKFAHMAAIQHKSPTCAVLGTGIDIEYPASNRDIYAQFKERSENLILSEFPLKTSANKYTFPWRNRLISGLSLGTVVIEAQERSGTLITANYAGVQGKEVFALPGNINSFYSTGTNRLIQDGAKLILGVEDILVEIPKLQYFLEQLAEKNTQLNLFDETEQTIYRCLTEGPKSLDRIVSETSLSVAMVQMSLTKLEMKGYISQLGSLFSIK